MPVIALLFFGCYLSVQLYLMNANSVDTVKATEGYINDSIIAQGIICRQETVLYKNGDGFVDYLTENGERVSGGHHLADVYPYIRDLENIRFIQKNSK